MRQYSGLALGALFLAFGLFCHAGPLRAEEAIDPLLAPEANQPETFSEPPVRRYSRSFPEKIRVEPDEVQVEAYDPKQLNRGAFFGAGLGLILGKANTPMLGEGLDIHSISNWSLAALQLDLDLGYLPGHWGASVFWDLAPFGFLKPSYAGSGPSRYALGFEGIYQFNPSQRISFGLEAYTYLRVSYTTGMVAVFSGPGIRLGYHHQYELTQDKRIELFGRFTMNRISTVEVGMGGNSKVYPVGDWVGSAPAYVWTLQFGVEWSWERLGARKQEDRGEI